VTRSVTVPRPVSATLTLTELGMGLANALLADHPGEREITLLGISVSNLVPESSLQLELPLGAGEEESRPPPAIASARWALDRAMDDVRARFGRDALGYAAVVFREAGGVPDEFRELAERDPDAS
jgi:DNA polymerase-4